MRMGRPPGPGPPPQPPDWQPEQRRRPWLWRWRRNALRRREDLIEAWIILVLWIVVAVGGVFAGVLAGRATDDSLSRQRAERYSVSAVLTEDAPWSSAMAGGDGNHVRAQVRWVGPDGVTHTGRTLVDAGHQAGYKLKVWTDQHGRLAPAPPGTTEAALQSALMGGSAAVGFGGLTYVAGRGLRLGIDSRRAARWDKEWEAVEPYWGHRMG
jgi:hypothetical protein